METALNVSLHEGIQLLEGVPVGGALAEDKIFRGFFEHAIEGFFQTAPDGRYLRANPALARIYGYESPEELMAGLTNLNDQLYVETKRREEFMQAMQNTGAVIAFESQVFRRDGSVIWISENARAVRDPTGAVVVYEGTVQDITARKQAENELRTSQRFIERVAHASPNILYVYDLIEQRYVYANERIFKILGLTFAEVIEMGPGFLATHTHPEDAWMLENRAKELANAEDGVLYECEFRLKHRDGDWRWINARETIFTRTADGSPHEVIGTGEDITEQNNMMKALMQSEERFRKFVEGADAIFWEREFTKGQFIYISPQVEKLLGYPVEDFYRLVNWLKLVHADDRDLVRQFLQRDEQISAADNAIEYRMETADKRTIWVRDLCHVAMDEGGALILQGFMLDVTQRRHAKEEIWRSQQQLRALSARLQSAREEERIHIAREIHDELGGALTALKMDVSRIAAARSSIVVADPNPGQEGIRAELDERLSAMPKLIDRTMEAVRRLASELRPPVLDAFGLSAAIEWQASEFQKRYGLRCELENGWRTVVHDQRLATAVFRIFQEILTNVARHSHASKVSVKMAEEPGFITLTVSDNGRGITEGERQESLGLLGMRERAVIFGGDVEIKGVAGKGTTVTMRIPFINPAGSAWKKRGAPKKERLWQ